MALWGIINMLDLRLMWKLRANRISNEQAGSYLNISHPQRKKKQEKKKKKNAVLLLSIKINKIRFKQTACTFKCVERSGEWAFRVQIRTWWEIIMMQRHGSVHIQRGQISN